jgi:uncharacterized protein (TIGR02271 family)
MEHAALVTVFDEDGSQAHLQGYSPRFRQFIIDFEGERLLVPADALVSCEDGSYTALLSFADLDRGAAEGSDEPVIVPLVEEQFHVDKRVVETGVVRVHTQVNEREEVIDEPLLEEHIDVERVPVNRPIDGPVSVRQEGDTTIVPVVREVLVVQKQLVLVEEIRLTRRVTEARRPQRVTLRGEEAHIERLSRDEADAGPRT